MSDCQQSTVRSRTDWLYQLVYDILYGFWWHCCVGPSGPNEWFPSSTWVTRLPNEEFTSEWAVTRQVIIAGISWSHEDRSWTTAAGKELLLATTYGYCTSKQWSNWSHRGTELLTSYCCHALELTLGPIETLFKFKSVIYSSVYCEFPWSGQPTYKDTLSAKMRAPYRKIDAVLRPATMFTAIPDRVSFVSESRSFSWPTTAHIPSSSVWSWS